MYAKSVQTQEEVGSVDSSLFQYCSLCMNPVPLEIKQCTALEKLHNCAIILPYHLKTTLGTFSGMCVSPSSNAYIEVTHQDSLLLALKYLQIM